MKNQQQLVHIQPRQALSELLLQLIGAIHHHLHNLNIIFIVNYTLHALIPPLKVGFVMFQAVYFQSVLENVSLLQQYLRRRILTLLILF